MADKNTIRNWFLTGLKPTQAQFWATWDSFWHKDEKIPITAIDNIENILAEKADAEALENHLTDAVAHDTLFAKAKIYENGELQIFRKPGTTPDPTNSEPNNGDYCIGFVEGQFISADYLGDDKTLLTSFNI